MLVPPHAIAGGYLIRTPRGPLPITLKKLRTFFGQGPESLEPAIRSLNQAIDMLDIFPGKLVAGHSRATRAPITEFSGHIVQGVIYAVVVTNVQD